LDVLKLQLQNPEISTNNAEYTHPVYNKSNLKEIVLMLSG